MRRSAQAFIEMGSIMGIYSLRLKSSSNFVGAKTRRESPQSTAVTRNIPKRIFSIEISASRTLTSLPPSPCYRHITRRRPAGTLGPRHPPSVSSGRQHLEVNSVGDLRLQTRRWSSCIQLQRSSEPYSYKSSSRDEEERQDQLKYKTRLKPTSKLPASFAASFRTDPAILLPVVVAVGLLPRPGKANLTTNGNVEQVPAPSLVSALTWKMACCGTPLCAMPMEHKRWIVRGTVG